MPSVDDLLPLVTDDGSSSAPSLQSQAVAEAARRRADMTPGPDATVADVAPAEQPPPSIMGSSWSKLGTDLWDAGVRGLGLGTRGVLQGAAALPAGVADLATWPGRALNRALGVPTTAPSTFVQRGIDATNLPQPQTTGEKLINAGVEAGTGALSTMGLGTSAAIAARWPELGARLAGQAPGASLARTIAQPVIQGTGGVAGEAAAEQVPDSWKPYVRLVGNVAGAAGAGSTINAGAKLANVVAGTPGNDLLQAFDRLRIDPTVGDVSGGTAIKQLQAFEKQAPITAGIMEGAGRRQVGQFGDAVQNTADSLSPRAVTPTSTGNIIQDEARKWNNVTFPQEQAAAWTPVNQKLAGTTVDPTGYRSALDGLTNELTKSEASFTPGRVQQLKDLLAVDAPPGQPLTWEQAQALRSKIGTAMGVPEISNSVGTDALKRLYGGLAGDMRSTANANGAGTAFDDANAVSTAGHAFRDNHLSKVISTNNPVLDSIRPEQATQRTVDAGDTTLQAFRDRIPAAADAAAAYKLRDMATPNPGQAGATGGGTSTGSFLTDYNRLRQNAPDGAKALYGDPNVPPAPGQPYTAGAMDDLATVAAKLRETEAQLNKSGTGRNVGLAALLTSVPTGAALGGWRGALTGAGAAGGGLALNAAIGNLLASPNMARYAATPGLRSQTPRVLQGLLGNAASAP